LFITGAGSSYLMEKGKEEEMKLKCVEEEIIYTIQVSDGKNIVVGKITSTLLKDALNRKEMLGLELNNLILKLEEDLKNET